MLLVVGLFALLAIVAMNFWLSQRAQVYFNQVIEARDARTAATELRNAIQMAESSQRGFLLTRNEIYLAPYALAKTLVARQLADVQETFKAYPDRAPLIDRIGVVVQQKLEEMEQAISLKRQGRDDLVDAIIRSNRGKALMDEANVLASGAVRAADEKLVDGVREHRQNANLLQIFSVFAALTVIVVVGSAAIDVARYTRELQQARNDLNATNSNLEQRVQERTKALQEANAEVQRFAYIVTHDLRAPLVNIMGFTSEVDRGVQDVRALVERVSVSRDESDRVANDALVAVNEDLPEAVDFIRSSTKKMDGLISAILRIAREGGRAPRPESIDLREVVEASAAAISHQLTEAGGAFKADLKVSSIVSDKLSVEQVLGNLLDNAVKYRAQDRPLSITVSTRALPGDKVCLRVQDNGRGIAEQDKERVFELFRRAGVLDQPGEGIGLAYVRAIVRKLGGDVTVSSDLGRGTSFDVLLPTSPMTAGTMPT